MSSRADCQMALSESELYNKLCAHSSITDASYGQMIGHGSHSSENRENVNGERSWFWAQSESLTITYINPFMLFLFLSIDILRTFVQVIQCYTSQ